MVFATENNLDPKIAMIIGMSVEEMAINTIQYNDNKIDGIDIFFKIGENNITIAFKDPGIEFDPSNYITKEEGSFENIEVLQKNS
ncbi:MAG: hypothetical protein PHY59_03385 [Methanobacterium sp.]|nr:hypothetical protein [Methanobacterium sp.]